MSKAQRFTAVCLFAQNSATRQFDDGKLDDEEDADDDCKYDTGRVTSGPTYKSCRKAPQLCFS